MRFKVLIKTALTTILLLLLWSDSSVNNKGKLEPFEEYDLPKRGVCAHRGASESHPENTVIAFNEAIRLGAQMIEFDVQLTKDQQLIIIHDTSIDRTTNGTGLIKDLTYEEIKHLDAGEWKSKKFKGEKIPLFSEALAGFPKNIWLNIHLKGNQKLGKAVATLIMKEKRNHQAIIACNKESAKGVKKVTDLIQICNMERMVNRHKYIKNTINGNFSTLQLLKRRNNDSLASDIAKLKENGIRINYHFSNTVEEGVDLFNMGVDFILTDRLETMLQAADSVGI